jgi:hypothetical protein
LAPFARTAEIAEPNVTITGPVIEGKQLRTDPINTLVTGIPYGHADVPNTEHTLRNAPMGNGSMIIDVVRSNPQTVVDGGGNSHTVYNYALAISVDGDPFVEYVVEKGTGSGASDNVHATGSVHVQSHWGSGVRFTSITVVDL